jgi:DNA repair exonuclease SbcCD ATPase subunit
LKNLFLKHGLSILPFISDALQYKNLPFELKLLEDEIKSANKNYDELLKANDALVSLIDLFKQFKWKLENISPRTNAIYPFIMRSENEILTKSAQGLVEFKRFLNSLIESSEKLVENYDEKNHLAKSLESLNYKIEYLESMEKIKSEVDAEIAALNDSLNTNKENFEKIKTEKDNKNKEVSDLTEFIQDHRMLQSAKSEYNSLSTQISTLNSKIAELSSKKDLLKEKKDSLSLDEKTLGNLKDSKTKNAQELLKQQTQLSKIKALNDKQKGLEDNFNNTKIIKDCLDPNKGIPLYFIKSYLEKTKDITNELLKIAFNGKFEIDFHTSASEFFIRVRSGSNIKSDIKEASQGEVALTTISISFALIEQAIGKFNILSLDEIDGPLDSSNRTNFINILERQAKKLDIEQIFVISHNDVFDLTESNLILLKGNHVDEDDTEYMKNKEIIFKA